MTDVPVGPINKTWRFQMENSGVSEAEKRIKSNIKIKLIPFPLY